jgi:hypothetical protein
MVWDLRGALLKKEERESARLADFEFKHRVRTFRLLARELGANEKDVAALIVQGSDAVALEQLRQAHAARANEITSLYESCKAYARSQLVKEVGNPAPYKLL